MNLVKSTIYQLSLIVLILVVNCTGAEPTLNPDFTGQEGKVSDIEGHIYKTIGIGSQIWIAENLRTTLLNDASQINSLSDDSLWNITKSPAFCWYNSNDSLTYGGKYGALYNFHTVRTGLLCPIGWHVPAKSEWETLIFFLGGDDIAGGKLKDPIWLKI
jgi:uncharacterized protein (TIGR02145 family)